MALENEMVGRRQPNNSLQMAFKATFEDYIFFAYRQSYRHFFPLGLRTDSFPVFFLDFFVRY